MTEGCEAPKPRQASDSWPMTRGEVAKVLGKSVTSVRRLEGKELHPRRDRSGTHLFDSIEVQALAVTLAAGGKPSRNADGELAAKVFTMLNAGHDLREIVPALKVPPQVVRELYEEWRTGLEDGWREARLRRRAEEQRRAAREVERADARAAREMERMTEEHEKTMERIAKLGG